MSDASRQMPRQAASGMGMLEVWADAVRPMNRATKLSDPERIEGGGKRYNSIRDHSRYDPDRADVKGHLCPSAICGTLWRDELFDIARLHGVSGILRGSYAHTISDALEASLPAPALHDEMIKALRRRAWRKPVKDLRKQ